MTFQERVKKIHSALLSEKVMHLSERVIITISIVSFLLHLALIFAADAKLLGALNDSELLASPISAIYTPFSFILFFEVYLLVYYLPKSITVYISKQYEIITLIVIRRLFKDLSHLELSSNWFEIQYDLQFTYDLIAAILLFFLIFVFNWLIRKNSITRKTDDEPGLKLNTYIARKKLLASLLVPVFVIMALYSLGHWSIFNILALSDGVASLGDLNEIFFDEFFTVLILTDVLLLLFSLFHTNEFSQVFRNSGFIISTILIRLSFGTEGLINSLLIIVAVLFGVIILAIYNRFLKLNHSNQNS